MIKPEWGTKRKCLECGTVFYDFKKEEPICPKCKAPFKKEALEEKIEKKIVAEDIPEDEMIVKSDNDDENDKNNEYNELDVEEDMINVDKNLINDDDIDNVFVDDSIDIEEDINDSIGTMEDNNF